MLACKIIIVDDNKSILKALKILLQFEYKSVQTIANVSQLSSIEVDSQTIVLLDMNFSAGVNTGNEGIYWLRQIKAKSPDCMVIMMTAYGDVELAVKALKEGASDFILKPWNNDKLLATLKSAYALQKSRREVENLKEKTRNLTSVISQDKPTIIGASKALQSVLKLTQKVARTDVNVLITGENGTGKELIARELHNGSERKAEVFIKVDVGTIAETLFESELFGHKKGAFTDAKEDRVGKFEAANGGTLFLDEIGNLSLKMQAKLLSVIQQKNIVRVGSNKSIPVDIRLVCATNGNLPEMVREGRFREDLFYRINTIHIEVPPLRERDNDIIVLAKAFLTKFSTKHGRAGLKLSPQAEQKLNAYHWPGNVRELEHIMERAVILSDQDVLEPDDFLLSNADHEPLEVESLTLQEMERLMIQRALEKHHGNYSAAANELGITRQTLYNKLKK